MRATEKARIRNKGQEYEVLFNYMHIVSYF